MNNSTYSQLPKCIFRYTKLTLAIGAALYGSPVSVLAAANNPLNRHIYGDIF